MTLSSTAPNVPRTLFIVPDGNRRSAKIHRRVAISAHLYGLRNAHAIIDAAFKRGIHHVIFWGASYGNFRDRDPIEVRQIFRLFKQEIRERLQQKDTGRFSVCGKWQDFTNDNELIRMVDELEKRTERYDDSEHDHLTILFGYDGRDDILHAVRAIISAGLNPEEVTSETFHSYLRSAGVPMIDLFIRTGEESDKPHLSKGALSWQLYDTELYFTKTLWPDFTAEEFDRVLEGWSARRRLNGK